MYTKTHTKAIVVGAYDVGESSRLYRLFTQELGMIYARCQASREVYSKQRFGLQFMSVSDVSLVRSKAGWRITNVTPLHSIFSKHNGERHKQMLAVRVLHLVKRLVVAEEQGGGVFSLVWDGLTFLEDEKLDVKNARIFEVLFVLRILSELGYVSDDELFKQHLRSPYDFSENTIFSFAPISKRAVNEINRALEASHL